MPVNRELQGGNSIAYLRSKLGLFNGFANVMIPFTKEANVTLRGGRQELLFGSQRLVGPGDFTQVPHTFDGGAKRSLGSVAGPSLRFGRRP